MKTRTLLLLTLCSLTAPAAAEDIELFLNTSSATSEKPNVLFLLDNSANWNASLYSVGNTKITKKNIIHQALTQSIEHPDVANQLNVGVMLFSSTLGGKVFEAVSLLDSAKQSSLSEALFGAKIWAPATGYAAGDLVVPSSPNGYYYKVISPGTSGSSEPVWPGKNAEVYDNGVGYATVGTLDDTVEKLDSYNNAPYATMMHEAYLYYAGLTPRYGTDDGDHDPAALSGGSYVSPAAASCAKNFIILIGSGSPDNGEDNTAETILRSLGGVLGSDPISLDPDNSESNWGDEFARWMAGQDLTVAEKDDTQNIVTYVIDVVDEETATTKPELGARAFLRSMAKQGQGRPFTAKNVNELTEAILSVIEEIKAVNSVFASTTLPVSVNVRGTNLNQVYMGVFRPDGNALPYWVGNLKLYRLALDSGTGSLFLADKEGNRADSSVTGFIVDEATSYWTHDSTFWSFHGEYDPSDAPDGPIVEKGAAAQQLRDSGSRNLYTCSPGACSGSITGTPFDNTTVSAADLGAADDDERDAIIDWITGRDVKDEDSDSITDEWRPSIHGDVLHSRPAVINYGSEDDIYAFYGSNDGIFHAVRGGRDTEANDGEEAWGFIPPEFYSKLKVLYDNDVAITDGGAKPYFADGNIGVYQEDGSVILYLSMRRGGRVIYALDVSSPEAPQVRWSHSSADAGWSELGQTWSEPKVAKINLGGTDTDVLIFGAGYDESTEDAIQPATMGRGIFVVDAMTGNILWHAGPADSASSTNRVVSGMVYAIPSDITVLDTDYDGYADRLYVGDTGGNVWRADIGSTDKAEWTVTRLFSDTTEGGRKFLYPPEVVYGTEEEGYDAVLLGSGDREHPLRTSTVDRFFMIKDDGSTDLVLDDLYDVTDNAIQTGDEGAIAALAGSMGWYITFPAGEKVVSSAVALNGSTFFNTNEPSDSSTNPNSCAPSLGTARNYIVHYADGTATQDLDGQDGLTTADRSTTPPGGGFPPSPVSGIVEIDGEKYEFVVSGTQVRMPPGNQLERRFRRYWYESID